MVNASTAPALPWGTEQGQAGSLNDSHSDAPSPGPVTASIPSHSGLEQIFLPNVDSKIEVKWQIEDEDKIESLWWKATVQSIELASSESCPSETAGVLRYEAFRDFGEETAAVVFVAEGRLYHTDNSETLLRWRKEGQQQIDSDEEDDGNQLVDANDLDQDEQLIERELGVSAEEVMKQQLQKYPMDQQRQLASGARAFVDHFREQLSQLAQAQGGAGYTVTENDVQGIFASLKQR